MDIENKHKNWSIEKGDYRRDDTATWRYQKKLIRRKKIFTALRIVVYLVVLAVVAHLVLSR
ncbi:MAG: hypothetical protein M0P71_10745 [Melioribacteraceae bacterium]|jgi:hypothetical protein|nr:hypothetical protein [Melioribacteraceae bacterium]